MALANVAMSVYITFVLTEKDFTRFGLALGVEALLLLKVMIGLIVCLMVVYTNIHFISRNIRARIVIALMQITLLVFVIRNLFLGFLHHGLMVSSYGLDIIGFILLSGMIYNTLFSENIIQYFSKNNEIS